MRSKLNGLGEFPKNQIAISGCVGSDQLDEFGRRLRQRGLLEELHPMDALECGGLTPLWLAAA